MNGRLLIVAITCRNQSEAQRLGKAAVDARLAACANAIPSVQSTFFWKSRLERPRESLLLLKTTRSQMRGLLKLVREMHSYSLPAIEWWEAESTKEYADWMRESVRTGKRVRKS